MGGVDLADHVFGRTGLKWWRYIFWFPMNLASTNAYILYKEKMKNNNEDFLSTAQFRLKLAEGLIGGSTAATYRRVQNKKINEIILKENIPGHSLIRMGRKLVCVLCSAEGRKAPSG